MPQRSEFRVGCFHKPTILPCANLMSCRVCLEVYSAEEKHSPRTLPCGHSFCYSCLVELQKKNGKIVECPTCRACHPVAPSGFPTNFDLLEVLESNIWLKPAPPRFCAEHKDEPVKLYCKGCQKLACAFCAGIGKHHGHVMVAIDKAAETLFADIGQQFTAILSDVDSTRAWLDDIKAEQKRLEVEQDEAALKITRSIEVSVENLRARERDLKAELALITGERQKQLELQLSEGCKALSILDSTKQEYSNLLVLDELSRLEVGGSWIQKARDVKKPELSEFKFPALVTECEPGPLEDLMLQWGRIGDKPSDYPFGTRVDARDSEDSWYPATVLQQTATQVYVRYDGCASKWNEWIDTESSRLQPFGTQQYDKW